MSLRKAIEAKIMAAVQALVGESASVVGFLQSSADGTIKESFGGRPEIRVTVAPAQAEGYASKVVEYSCKIAVNLDLEDDPTQSTFDEVGGIVENLVLDWNETSNLADTKTAIEPEGFNIVGFRADGGQDTLDLTRESPRISTVYAFAIKGIITQEERG